jgi:acyl-CoA thioester hydrolase
MTDQFRVRVAVRGYEVDANGHVAGTVLLQYGHHARWELLRAAGVDHAALLAAGTGPVSLQESIRYHRELRAGEEVDVSCAYLWGDGKTFRIEQELRLPDGTLVAEITNVGGLLDLSQRRLVPDPGPRWRAAALAPALLGLGA